MITKNRRFSFVAVLSATVLVVYLCVPAFASAHPLFSLDASMGYLFVSEAEGTPWFYDTGFPSVSLGLGGDTWSMGLSADYAKNGESYDGSVPGYTDAPERVETRLTNASVRLSARIFPGGRDNVVSPYLGVGVGPALTSVEHEGTTTGRRESDSAVRVCYSVSVGSKLRFGKSPFSAFFEGSFGGLGALSHPKGEEVVTVPRQGFDFVRVAAGLDITFR